MTNQKFSLKYILVIAATVFLTWLIHEFGHWLMGILLGYSSTMTLNGTSYHEGQNVTDWHKNIVSAAGPLVTLIQGLLAFLYLRTIGWCKHVYPILFTAFYMRLLAGLMNFIMLNDEGRIGAFLGIGTFTLSILISGSLFYMVYLISKKYRLNWKLQLATTLLVMFFSSALIMVDQFFHIRLL